MYPRITDAWHRSDTIGTLACKTGVRPCAPVRPCAYPSHLSPALAPCRPRFYIMRLPARGLRFHRITYHGKVTQCLGSLTPGAGAQRCRLGGDAVPAHTRAVQLGAGPLVSPTGH